MTFKKALAVWILVVFCFLAILGIFHAWILWRIEGVSTASILSFQIEVTTYFFTTLATTLFLIGAVCYAVFRNGSLDLPLYQLSKDFEEKLDAKSEEIKSSTDEALTKLGLREFQLKESMKALQEKLGELDDEFKNSVDNHEKSFGTMHEKLMNVEHKIDKIQTVQKDLIGLKKKLNTVESIGKNLESIQEIVEKLDFVPKPYLTSTNEIKALEGKLLKRDTVQQLKLSGVERIEDLLLKNPVEIALTKTMTESEAKSLQSVIRLLMIPGIQHEDAVLLLKSGVNSKEELSLQDTFSLGARISKVAELYIKEGKIKETEKPTLEKVASWIKWAKTQ